ncbi:hypothetical protein B296_00041426 [Ensete ventricosum]|uniref:Secreted protein n=1 Tax=Ensete ventricosum TaxID=4639 RepID=A0A426XZI4_ENSVE|nr:hypothetical protein B296_00041426 [Ensete ventricosum]
MACGRGRCEVFLLLFFIFSSSSSSLFLPQSIADNRFLPQSTVDGRFWRYRPVAGGPRTGNLADRYRSVWKTLVKMTPIVTNKIM